MDEVFRWMGVLLAVYSDGGRHFKWNLRELFVRRNVRHFIAPPYHPQSVGLAELVVQLVLYRLPKFHVDNAQNVEDNWDLYLRNIENSLNNRDIKRFGFTPSQLMFGRDTLGNKVLSDPREELVASGEILPELAESSNEEWRERTLEFLTLREENQRLMVEQRLESQDKKILKEIN